jgi:hypothetical protein
MPPDSVDESELPAGILTVLADHPQQALAAVLRCRPATYDQVAVLMGVSRDRARQLEIRAAGNLRRAFRFRQLCRFIPGWQNALRLPPNDATSVLPGETIPAEFMRKRQSPYKPEARRAFEHTLAIWERLGGPLNIRNEEDPRERKMRLARQKNFDAIFSLKYDALERKKKRKFSKNFRLCEMFLKVNGKPACQGCPIKELTGAPGCKHTPLTEALRKSRLGIKDPQFQSAAGRMATFMRDVWTKTNHLKKKIKL